ncbi:aminoglycoside phosphotransferase family protein [Roseibium polysiphoniae]|uniref:Aminoglycoside phosphotransferase n=1 Tax=Roseibium polysiphoniae TaxID=2571221 RepID=A0ABR9CFC7_9HYPH|nr:aminoglycoside phosphotransferase family protein [Roseibium polysiphoniae]MBD8877597.1 aminoglycoside phosphotransferase [Roseibium polysiphoniae]
MKPPETLAHVCAYEGGAAWLARLPDIFDQCVENWNLTKIGAPYGGSNVSFAVPVERDGDAAVLKIQLPSPESEHEAAALSIWDGDGAVRLLAHDPARCALLLERCEPGDYLADASDVDPLTVVSNLLPHLWKPAAAPFTRLADAAAQWAQEMPEGWKKAGQPCERYLVDAGIDYLTELGKNQRESVLLHQDLHGHNIISAERNAWLAIDPKPLVGERAFSIAPLVRSFEFGHTKEATLYRLDRLSDELGLDRKRALGWTVAQTMAWSFDGGYVATHHQTVRWLLGRSS